MADINGTNIAAGITPFTDGDRYPTHYPEYGRGGKMEVPDAAARNAIPQERRSTGMFVTTQDDGKTWQLVGGGASENDNWRELGTGTPPSPSPDPVPLYIEEAVPDFAAAVEADRAEGGLTFVAVADVHAHDGNPAEAKRLESVTGAVRIANVLGADFTVNLGDMAQDQSTGLLPTPDSARYLADLRRQSEMFARLGGRYLAVKGNHDTGLHDRAVAGAQATAAHYITPQQFYDAQEAPFAGRLGELRVRNEGAEAARTYYYTDYFGAKVRVITLDSMDLPDSLTAQSMNVYGFRSPQMKWLAERALNLSGRPGYSVMLLCHTPPTPLVNASYNTGTGMGETFQNSDVLAGILEAFTSGADYSKTFTQSAWNSSADNISAGFSAQGAGKALFWMHGHAHLDNITTPEGFPLRIIGLQCSIPSGVANLIPGSQSTPTSERTNTSRPLSYVCVTACNYHPEDNTLHVFRFGAATGVFDNSMDYAQKRGTYPATIIQLNAGAAASVTGFSLTPPSLPASGGTVTAEAAGKNLDQSPALSVSFNSADYPMTVLSPALAQASIPVPPNAGQQDAVMTAQLLSGGGYTGKSASVTVAAGAPAVTHALRLNQASYISFSDTGGKPIATWSKLSFRVRPDTSSNTRNPQWLLSSPPGGPQRLNFAMTAGKWMYGFGATSSSVGTAAGAPNADYTVDLVISDSGAARTFKAYVNGVLDKELSDAAFSTAPGTLGFGASDGNMTPGSAWSGLVYDIRLIAADGSDYAHYDMQDGSGAALSDASGNGRHAALTGSYEWVEV